MQLSFCPHNLGLGFLGPGNPRNAINPRHNHWVGLIQGPFFRVCGLRIGNGKIVKFNKRQLITRERQDTAEDIARLMHISKYITENIYIELSQSHYLQTFLNRNRI